MFNDTNGKSAAKASFNFGFAEQMRTADLNQFRNWYDRRCLLGRGAEPQVSVDATADNGERGIERLAA